MDYELATAEILASDLWARADDIEGGASAGFARLEWVKVSHALMGAGHYVALIGNTDEAATLFDASSVAIARAYVCYLEEVRKGAGEVVIPPDPKG